MDVRIGLHLRPLTLVQKSGPVSARSRVTIGRRGVRPTARTARSCAGLATGGMCTWRSSTAAGIWAVTTRTAGDQPRPAAAFVIFGRRNFPSAWPPEWRRPTRSGRSFIWTCRPPTAPAVRVPRWPRTTSARSHASIRWTPGHQTPNRSTSRSRTMASLGRQDRGGVRASGHRAHPGFASARGSRNVTIAVTQSGQDKR